MWLMSKVQHTHIWSPRSKERNWVEAVFGKIIVKSFQTDERYQLTDSRSSVNPQKGLKKKITSTHFTVKLLKTKDKFFTAVTEKKRQNLQRNMNESVS